MVFPNVRPASPPPPMPKGLRRVGINVDADGKRTRLPGDTVRQNVTPGRIRNLARMFDIKAKIQEKDENDNILSNDAGIADVYSPRDNLFVSCVGEQSPTALDVSLLVDDEPVENAGIADVYSPRDSLFVSCLGGQSPTALDVSLLVDDEPVKKVDNERKKRNQTRVINGHESDHFFPVKHSRSRTTSRGDDHNVNGDTDTLFEFFDEHLSTKHSRSSQECLYQPRYSSTAAPSVTEMKIQSMDENDNLLDEEITDAYSPRDSLFVSCVGEQSPTALKVSMLMDDEPMKNFDNERKKRNQTVVINGNESDHVFPIEHYSRSRTTSRGDDQSVNGHIDNLFEFVDEHLSTKHSRSSRECLYQPRYSPTAAPNVAEMSQDCSIAAQGKTNKSNNSKSSKRVGSALATSTPQTSPQSTSTNQNKSRVGEDELSFVSTIQDASQVEAITHYELMISKNEHALDRNNQQIAMLVKALAHARKERKPMQEVNAQKSLLVAKERVVLLQRENKRLKALVACRRPIPNQCLEVRGSLTISNIAVHLNRNFYTRPYEINSNYSFLVMLKCGCEVECTATHNLLAHQSTRLKVVHFDEKINFCNLPVDFCVMLEVYAMAIPEKEPETTCASIIASKCRKILPKERIPTTSPSGFPYGEFVRCGYLQLTRDTTGTNKFYLDDVEYPLDGTVELTTHCTTLPPAIAIDYRGFLTMYQCISGMSSWERYWAVLRRGIIFFWKYPEDESMEKPPKARLDLSTCPQYEIHPCSVEQCPRAYTFTVNVLVNTAPSVMDKKRIFLSADSRSLMKDWLDAINETLAVIRGHHPYKGSILPRN